MFARTRRLTLRPAWAEDAAAIAQAIGHENVVTKISHAPWPYGTEDARQFLSRIPAADEATCVIVAHDGSAEPRLIGCIGVHPSGDGAHEIGYWLTPDAWGRGYATEAGLAMLGIARFGLGLKRLASGHYVDNPASGRVLRKLGFRPTGRVVQQHCRARGVDVACVRYERALAEDERTPERLAA